MSENKEHRNLTHVPKYLGICQTLKEQIEKGDLGPGDYLPPESQLAESYGVSLGTMKRALGELQAQHYVQRRRGHGTQVSGRRGRSQDLANVLVLVGNMGQSFFADIMGGAIDELEQNNCNPIVHETWHRPERERALLEKYAGQAQGYVVVPCVGGSNEDLFRQLPARGTPLVFAVRYLPELDVDAVVSDNRRGGYLATRHLLELGHRRILVLGVGETTGVRHRLEGYRQALEEYGVAFDPELVHRRRQSNFEDAYEFVGSYLPSHRDVTAAFCLPDEAAWGCLQRLSEMNIRVPEDFSVVGYDDNRDICSRVRPRLTTVRQMKREIGRLAAQRVVWRLTREEPLEPGIVSMPVELVVRESTSRAPETTVIV